MKSYSITSIQNKTYKIFQDLLSTKGVVEHRQVLVSGEKILREVCALFPNLCLGFIRTPEMDLNSLPQIASANEYVLDAEMFRALDLFGTRRPILLASLPPIAPWVPGLSGCQLVIPFQEPSNVGAAIRSAAAFGVKNILLLGKSAHPFHPKSIRASSGTVFSSTFFRVKELGEFKAPGTAQVYALDTKGLDVNRFKFSKDFILVPGVEGPGLPPNFRPDERLTIKMEPGVESLNGATAVSIALFSWYSDVIS